MNKTKNTLNLKKLKKKTQHKHIGKKVIINHDLVLLYDMVPGDNLGFVCTIFFFFFFFFFFNVRFNRLLT